MHSGLRHGSEPRLGRTRDVGPRRHELPFPRLSSARRRQDSGFPGEGTDGPAGQRAAGSWASVRGLGPVTWHDFEHLASGHLWQEHSALRVTFSNKRTASPASHRRSGSPRWASWPLPGQPGFIARGPGVPGLLPAGRGLGQGPAPAHRRSAVRLLWMRLTLVLLGSRAMRVSWKEVRTSSPPTGSASPTSSSW